MSVALAPSLLSADFSRLGEAARACEDGGADWIHFDVMDGRFVPNLTVGPIVLDALRKATRVPFDVHLMIEEPLSTLDQYLDAGAGARGRARRGRAASPSVRPARARARRESRASRSTRAPSLASLDEALLFVDFVLVMTVNPGWGGQTFIAGSLDRVARLSEIDPEVRFAGDHRRGRGRGPGEHRRPRPRRSAPFRRGRVRFLGRGRAGIDQTSPGSRRIGRHVACLKGRVDPCILRSPCRDERLLASLPPRCSAQLSRFCPAAARRTTPRS